ncbi:MAG: hypothetical protein LBK76_01530 [Verrucomicrobiales bacterium]|jgi:hypothetical protein|nr:hypothetical protein [Verrucomicrobiales bacterium]
MMTPDLQAALVCEDIRIEASGANTLVGVINVIAAPNYPLRVIKLCVYTRWNNGQGSFKQGIRILNEAEQEIGRTETPFVLRGQDSHTTNIAVFGGLEFRQPGDYAVEILLDDDLKLRFIVRAIQVPSAPSAP